MQITQYSLHNKKFELMLTGRATAYSSFCSQTVSLSPAISTRLLRGYRCLMPSCAGFLNRENRDLDRRSLRSLLIMSYAVCPCLSQLVSAQFPLEMCLADKKSPKKHKIPYFGVQGHSRSLKSVAIESQCTTYY